MRYFTALSITFIMLPSAANALSCAPPPPPRIAASRASAVFTGRVIEANHRERRVKFDVQMVWKGVPGSEVPWDGLRVLEVEVHHDSWSSFEKGRVYLVYATQEDDRLFTHTCSRTKQLEYALDDIIALGQPPYFADTVEPEKYDSTPYWTFAIGLGLGAGLSMLTAAVYLRRSERKKS